VGHSNARPQTRISSNPRADEGIANSQNYPAVYSVTSLVALHLLKTVLRIETGGRIAII
jgi:hypothetical protein